MKILSTKILNPPQKQLIIAAGFSLMEYDAIKIKFLEIETPNTIDNAIFTSQNSVSAILKSLEKLPSLFWEGLGVGCFCVGLKTAALLTMNNFKVVKTAAYGSELGHYIVENHPNEHFVFFCGNKRREELPAILREGKVNFEEIEVYRTVSNPKHFGQTFDAVLLFSPSGVESFVEKNDFGKSLAVCIGDTTAAEARKYSDSVAVSNSTSVESVIARAVKV